jgi:hypothetical protein
MRSIWKYNIPAQDEFSIAMPKGAEILSIQDQYGQPRMWVLVDTTEVLVERRFAVVGTGHVLGETWFDLHHFLGTFQMLDGDLIFHLFEEIE